MIDIKNILASAMNERCVFHSEADFQHHFAWEIHRKIEDAKLRLEYPLSKDYSNRWEYCDILLRSNGVIGLELKYKTKLLSTKVNDEQFELKNQGAQDIGRYDFLKDVSRLETWYAQGRIKLGYAIILTNDHSYWTPPTRDTVDKEFRIHDRTLSGRLSWGVNASAGTTKNREQPILIKEKYMLNWSDTPNPDFKYLLIKITGHTRGN